MSQDESGKDTGESNGAVSEKSDEAIRAENAALADRRVVPVEDK
jgi:hypothetical protein